MRVLVVCLGNICRSPLAEGILKSKIERLDLDWIIDSAGTGDWHIGELPDERAIKMAMDRGIDITNQRARQIKPEDLDWYDIILTMDKSNYHDVREMSKPHHHRKIIPITDFFDNKSVKSIPDPYFDGRFEEVFDLLDLVTDCFLGKMFEGTQPVTNQG